MPEKSCPQSVSVTCRISPSLKIKGEKLVDSGDYSSFTDLVQSALHYYINRYELRKDMLYTLVDEMDRRLDYKLTERLYSPENEKFLHGITHNVALQVVEELKGGLSK